MTFEDILAGLRPHIRRMVRESLQEILLSTDDGDLVTPKIACNERDLSAVKNQNVLNQADRAK